MSALHPALLTLREVQDPAGRLVCFPYAGATAAAYRRWANALRPDVETVLLQLSGRGARYGEPLHDTVEDYLDDALAAFGALTPVPTVFQGHSLGAVLAHATILALRGETGMPRHVVLSGCIPPGTPRAVPHLHGLSDEALLAALQGLGGAAAEALAHAGLMQSLLPALRADIRMAELWPCPDRSPFDVPITAVAGTRDPVASEATMAGWDAFTTGSFEVRVLDGGHFFLHESEGRFLEILDAVLERAIGVDFGTENDRLSTQ